MLVSHLRLVPRRPARTALILSFALVSAGLAQSAGNAAPSAPGGEDEGLSRMRGTLPQSPAAPAPRNADGKPDLSGYWKPVKEPGQPGGNIGKDLPGFQLPFTAAGKAALEHNLTKTIDPEALCILGGIPRHNASGLPFEIVHHPSRIAVLYWYNTHRLVAIGDHLKFDAELDPKYFGNAIAKWEGDTLVIESRSFHDSKDGKLWIDENANPQSAETHVIERWTRLDEARLQLVMTINDPVYYTKPFTFTRVWVKGRSGEGLNEYACNENNIDAAHLGPGPGPIGPDGTRGTGYSALPANPPPPEFYEQKP